MAGSRVISIQFSVGRAHNLEGRKGGDPGREEEKNAEIQLISDCFPGAFESYCFRNIYTHTKSLIYIHISRNNDALHECKCKGG